MAREIKTAARMRLEQGRQLQAKADIDPRMETSMTMKQRLLRAPPPECDESLLGYVIRLTEANHYDNASWVTSLASLNVSFSLGGWKVLNRDDTDLTPMETLAGLSLGTLEAMKYQVPRWVLAVSFQGTSLPSSVVRLKHPRVCPACLRESNYCRRIWDLLPYTACLVHEAVLLDICPGCHGRVSWVRSKVSSCRCGFDWRDALCIKASPSGLKATRRIGELCRGAADCMTGDRGEAQLCQLSLDELCRALSIFAEHYQRMKKREWLLDKIENLACHEAFGYAFSILEDWPGRFEEFMEDFWRSISEKLPKFRPFIALHEQFRDGTLDYITIAIEEFIDNLLSQYDGQLYGLPTLLKRFIPAENIGRYILAGPVNLRRLLESGQLRTYNRERHNGRNELLVDLNSVIRYGAKLASCYTGGMVAAHLGIGVDDVLELVQYGCLVPVSGPPVDGLYDWRFSYEEPEKLLEAVGAKVLDKTGSNQRERLFWREVLSLLRKHDISVGRFVRDVLDGKLAPLSKCRSRGLTMFTFDKQEFTDYVFAITRVKSNASEYSVLVFRQLARTLGRVKERNDRVHLRGVSNEKEPRDWSYVTINDLLCVATWLFGKVRSDCLEFRLIERDS
jgi:hypothetical protein